MGIYTRWDVLHDRSGRYKAFSLKMNKYIEKSMERPIQIGHFKLYSYWLFSFHYL
jgi:hypothetical protein